MQGFFIKGLKIAFSSGNLSLPSVVKMNPTQAMEYMFYSKSPDLIANHI